MEERPTVNVAVDDMEWSRRYSESALAPEAVAVSATERIVESPLLPIPVKATGVVAVHIYEFAAGVMRSIFKQR